MLGIRFSFDQDSLVLRLGIKSSAGYFTKSSAKSCAKFLFYDLLCQVIYKVSP